MLNLLNALNLRLVPIPESCHPLWNDTLRALASSKLKGSVLKGTLLVNYYKGPFCTKKNRYTVQQAATLLADTCSDAWLDEMQESFQFDRRSADEVLTRDAILEAPGIANRLPAATMTARRHM